jgi:hypothetical protein
MTGPDELREFGRMHSLSAKADVFADAWEACEEKLVLAVVARDLAELRLEAAERRCDPCGLSLAECMDARRAGKLACCPECSHPALAGEKREAQDIRIIEALNVVVDDLRKRSGAAEYEVKCHQHDRKLLEDEILALRKRSGAAETEILRLSGKWGGP